MPNMLKPLVFPPLVLSLVFSPLVLRAQTGALPVAAQSQTTPAATQSSGPIQAPAGSQQLEEVQHQLRAEAEEGVKHMLTSQIEAWNRHDLEGFMQGYWHSPQLDFFSDATVTKGWEPTLERYRHRYQSQGKEMGQLEFQNLNIDVIGRRAAVVTGSWQLTMSDGAKPHGLFTLIVKRTTGGWKIVHDHTSAAQ